MVLGNAVCLVGYAVVLWRFFRRRIESRAFLFLSMPLETEGGVGGAFTNVCTEEETLLIGFFGMDYVRYRDRTRVGIPFIP